MLSVESTRPSPLLQHQKVSHTLTAKELSLITHSVPRAKWKELGQKLGLPAEDMQKLLQAKPRNRDSLNDVLRKWLSKQREGESLQILDKVLPSIGQRSVTDLLKSTRCSDNDSLWLK